MDSEKGSHRTQIIVAVIGVIGVIAAAVIARWGLPVGGGASAPTETRPRTEPEASPRPVLAIGGRWVDNWGAEFNVTQSGHRFQFTGTGSACRGPFTSQGSGMVSGLRTESTYRTAYSTGSCSGAISSDGSRIVNDCTDSVCGPFRSVAERR